ncbi:flagellar biosynthesis regulator FlaF [Rhodovulum sp.]|mgnify:CR=1 FL=1|uniref:flagellar biosynthesis regulator FlaF n=1 Tax=Rhodovulum sp. TaxID=34009 RepID=UPI0017D0E75D|nr:flagellar biosynthesis regulator FlaF [Rhodovulum sp.]HDR28242.1 flagellar biosynthesis regulatory protein FlaF [Rhodovulum sp.]
MNALHMAQTAYSAPAQARMRTPRATEYAAFARITARLKAADAAGRRNFPALVAAIHDNRTLWTMLAADVADGENGLPPALRARIFYLFEFTTHHSRLVLNGKADIGPLVEINTAVMRGLEKSEAVA